MQERRDAGKERCSKEGMQERRDSGLQGLGIQEKRDLGLARFRTGGMQERRVSGLEGYRKGGIQDCMDGIVGHRYF